MLQIYTFPLLLVCYFLFEVCVILLLRSMIYFLLSCLIVFGSQAICHPEVSSKKKQYVIGYGSLINERSKRATVANVSDNMPVEIRGFRRGWYHVAYDQVFLGAVRDPKYGFNAVVFSLDDSKQIKEFDVRKKNYCRKLVPQSKIKSLGKEQINGDVWIYVSSHPKYLNDLDDNDFAEASYIYTFLLGCLDVEQENGNKDYLNECLNHTYQWPKQIRYDLNNKDKFRKSRILPNSKQMHEINQQICSSNAFLQHLDKRAEFYLKVCGVS